MNRIDNEQIKFYLEHESMIREWASLEVEVCKFVDGFYRSLKNDLEAAVRCCRIAESGVESFFSDGVWPGLGLRRQDWPEGDGAPDVRLEWNSKSARFSADGWLICGVRTNDERYKAPFTREARPAYPRSSIWWPAFKDVDAPSDRFWEGDNLKVYRNHLVETILEAWRDLAPLVDEAVGHQSS